MKTLLSLMLVVLVLLAPMLNVIGVGSTPAAAQAPSRGSITVPVTTSQGPGSLTITRFAVQNGQLVAIGLLTIVGTVVLVLGPLDLNLLGLMVHLNQVVLDISAQPGAGNLLGNLLCAIANLLNQQSPLSGLAALLTQLLGQLAAL